MPGNDAEFQQALAALWAIPRPGPDNLLYAPEFLRLRDLIIGRFGKPQSADGLSSALWNALRSLGLPCGLPTVAGAESLPSASAAARLLDALSRTRSTRVHLCPLDMAGDLPDIASGAARVVLPSASELAQIVDLPKLRRWGLHFDFDVSRLLGLRWLIVEETITHDGEPGQRALPLFYANFDADFARIEPHAETYPRALERALFGLIVAPWDTWTATDFDWRPFRIRWAYTADDDLFARPPSAPAVEALTWDEWQTPDGDWIERAYQFHLLSEQTAVRAAFADGALHAASAALDDALFEVPIAHFMVSAFTANGIDQFLHHITAIEAALGLPHDYPRPGQDKPTVRPKVAGRERVQHRIVGLLDDPEAGSLFERLFDLRSQFLHGRRMDDICGADRVAARALARRVVAGLITVSGRGAASRSDYLEQLLQRGLALCGRAPRPTS